MAIYHCNISNVSRAKGSTSLATLSYISAEKVYDENLDKTFHFGRQERVLYTNTLIPEYAPKDFQNPSVLFNSLEKFERADNARTAKKIEVALPRELSLNQYKLILDSYIRDNLIKESYCATYAIHTDKANNNPHAHILVANRPLNEQGAWSIKRKMEYALDDNGERIPRLNDDGTQKVDKQGRKQWLRVNKEQNILDKKEFLQSLRQEWAKECNSYLTPEQQIDHRSYAEQGIEQLPTIHLGYKAYALEKKGIETDIGTYNREVQKINIAILQKIREIFRRFILSALNKTKLSFKKFLTLREYENRNENTETIDYGELKDLLQRVKSRFDNARERNIEERREDIGTFIRELNAKTRNSLIERENRENERKRLIVAREQESTRKNKMGKDSSESRSATSRDDDFER